MAVTSGSRPTLTPPLAGLACTLLCVLGAAGARGFQIGRGGESGEVAALEAGVAWDGIPNLKDVRPQPYRSRTWYSDQVISGTGSTKEEGEAGQSHCLVGMHAIVIGGVGEHRADEKHVKCAGRLKNYIEHTLGLQVHHLPPVFLTPDTLLEATDWLVEKVKLDPIVIQTAKVPRGQGGGPKSDLALKGVALAHMNAYKYIVDSGIQHAFIFEADADLVPEFLETFCPLWDARPPDGYFFQVGTQFSRSPTHKMWDMAPHVSHHDRGSCCKGGRDECYRWMPGTAWGLNAYIVSNEAAGVMYGLATGGDPWHAVADELNYKDHRRYYLSMELPAETELMASGGSRPEWLAVNVQCGLGLQRVGECSSVRHMIARGNRSGRAAKKGAHHMYMSRAAMEHMSVPPLRRSTDPEARRAAMSRIINKGTTHRRAEEVSVSDREMDEVAKWNPRQRIANMPVRPGGRMRENTSTVRHGYWYRRGGRGHVRRRPYMT